MPRTRRAYPPEFRQQIVELHRAGRSPGELAREFEPNEQTIRNWIAQADLDEGRRRDGLTTVARIIHKFSTAAWEFPAPTALRSVGLLDVLHEYASGGLGRKPCQNGPSPASLRKLMNNPG